MYYKCPEYTWVHLNYTYHLLSINERGVFHQWFISNSKTLWLCAMASGYTQLLIRSLQADWMLSYKYLFELIMLCLTAVTSTQLSPLITQPAVHSPLRFVDKILNGTIGKQFARVACKYTYGTFHYINLLQIIKNVSSI